MVANADELGLFEFGELVSREGGATLTTGTRLIVKARVQNLFASGRHFVHLGIHGHGDISIYVHKALSFVVFGTQQSRGVIALDYEVEASVEDGGPR